MLRREIIANQSRHRRKSRRFTKGIVDPADLKLVFEHFEVILPRAVKAHTILFTFFLQALDHGLMDFDSFKNLLHALKLHLKDDEVNHLFQHLAVDVGSMLCFNSFIFYTGRTGSWVCTFELFSYSLVERRKICTLYRPEDECLEPQREVPRINVDQFLAGIRRHRFLRRIVSLYTFSDPRSWEIPASYDYTKPTHENYGDHLDKGYVGELKQLRERVLDPSWHGNYSPPRQLWQDAVAHAVALPRDDTKCQQYNTLTPRQEENNNDTSGECAAPERRPWLVFTAGAMGAGKSHSMNWMSARDILPLRNIVHVDPDRFKQMMPEYHEYLRRDRASAGTMCHHESGLLAELAQEIAMEQRLHVWVDGSLRDFEWHAEKIKQLRQRHPHYRIALFYVHASEDTVRARVKKRAERLGGRDVPETVLSASLAAPAHTLRALTPMVDFVARILNEDEPVLQAFETVDTSGDWTSIAEMFGGFYRVNPVESTGGLSRKSSLGSFSSVSELEYLSTTPPRTSSFNRASPPRDTQRCILNNNRNFNGPESSSPREPSAISLFEELTDRLHRAEREAKLLRVRCDQDAQLIASLRTQLGQDLPPTTKSMDSISTDLTLKDLRPAPLKRQDIIVDQDKAGGNRVSKDDEPSPPPDTL